LSERSKANQNQDIHAQAAKRASGDINIAMLQQQNQAGNVAGGPGAGNVVGNNNFGKGGGAAGNNNFGKGGGTSIGHLAAAGGPLEQQLHYFERQEHELREKREQVVQEHNRLS
jgi:hypothetical protein